MIKRVFRDATNPVAAHFAFRSIDIEHAHAHIGFVGWQDEDQPVGTDPKMPVGDFARDRGRISDVFDEAVDVNVIVADAVHLGEPHAASVVAQTNVYHEVTKT